MKIKKGDKVLIKFNSHYPEPRKVGRVYSDGTFTIVGVRCSGRRTSALFREHEVYTEDVYNSPLFKAIHEN